MLKDNLLWHIIEQMVNLLEMDNENIIYIIVIIDGRNFYDNPIESDIEKYRELKKVMIGKGEDYTTGSLLDFNYFDKHYKLVAVDLSKQKELDADPRAIQQIEFKYMLGTNSTIYWILEKSKETILEFYKGTVKVY